MKKKLFVVLIALCLVLSLCSCGGGSETSESKRESSESETISESLNTTPSTEVVYIEVPVIVEKIIEVPVEVPIEVVVEKEVIVEVEKEVIVEVEKEVIVEKEVEVIVEVEKEVVVEKEVEVLVYVDREVIVEIEKECQECAKTPKSKDFIYTSDYKDRINDISMEYEVTKIVVSYHQISNRGYDWWLLPAALECGQDITYANRTYSHLHESDTLPTNMSVVDKILYVEYSLSDIGRLYSLGEGIQIITVYYK